MLSLHLVTSELEIVGMGIGKQDGGTANSPHATLIETSIQTS